MKQVGRYEVVGRRVYRGHKPGEVFDAYLDVPAERRAIGRGSIRLIERVPADLTAGMYRLPAGWPAITTAEGR